MTGIQAAQRNVRPFAYKTIMGEVQPQSKEIVTCH